MTSILSMSKAAAVLLVASMGLLAQTPAAKDIPKNDKYLAVGTARDKTGKPLSGVMVTAYGKSLASDAVTVFSDETGNFRFTAADLAPRKNSSGLAFKCKKLGYAQAIAKMSASGHAASIDCTLEEISNVAADVPASAWLGLTPNTKARYITTTQCVQCHQMPWSKARTLASATREQSEAEREATWRGMVQYMREMSLHVVGAASRQRFQGASGSWRSDPERAFLSRRVENELVPFLAKYLPTDYSTFSLSQYSDKSPVNVKAVVKEYKLTANPNSWDREVVATTSPFIWGLDLGNSTLLKLNPATGQRERRAIPGDKKTIGPHTITASPDGNIWISLEELSGIGIFDPRTEKWKIHKNVVEPGAITHDFATDSHGQVSLDNRGRAWLSVVSKNRIAAFNPMTAKSQEFEVPSRADGAPEPTLPYGIVMTPDKKHVWFSEHAADLIGSFSTEFDKLDFTTQLPAGSAPRRMTIDDSGVVWAALSGSSQLLQIDPVTKKTTTHDLPDRASSPYNATWDPVRKVVWVGTTNADKVYCFDPRRISFTQIPLPTQGAYLRVLSLHPKTGHLWTTYANKLGDVGPPSQVVEIDPGNHDGC